MTLLLAVPHPVNGVLGLSFKIPVLSAVPFPTADVTPGHPESRQPPTDALALSLPFPKTRQDA